LRGHPRRKPGENQVRHLVRIRPEIFILRGKFMDRSGSAPILLAWRVRVRRIAACSSAALIKIGTPPFFPGQKKFRRIIPGAPPPSGFKSGVAAAVIFEPVGR